MVSVQLDGLTKRFGDVTAVDEISLSVNQGELFFLLGPSGCGKTTLLRLIGGFYQPDAGNIKFDGRSVEGLPAFRRNAAMVFQNYALFPHMTVYENVAYGLHARKLSRIDVEDRVPPALDLVQMSEFGGRFPAQLSGGQQQRVALARALIVQPDVLLLDEPLSNLDAQLRVEMRGEIRRIQQESRLTTIYVTHDQEEALSIADRIAVINDGCIEQIATPYQIYRKPATRFVSQFIGKVNIIEGTVQKIEENHAEIESTIGNILSQRPDSGIDVGDAVLCVVRPESVCIIAPGSSLTAHNKIHSTIADTTYLGDHELLHLKVDGVDLTAIQVNPREESNSRGNEVIVTFEPDDVILLAID